MLKLMNVISDNFKYKFP